MKTKKTDKAKETKKKAPPIVDEKVEAVNETKPLFLGGEEEGNHNGNHNGADKIDDNIKAGDIANAFTRNEGYSSIRVLVEPGDIEQFRSMLMRGDVPKNRTEAHIQIIAAMQILSDCEHFHYEEGKTHLLNSFSAFASAEGKRIDQVVDSIIGERRQQAANKFEDKAKNFMKNGFGAPKEDGV